VTDAWVGCTDFVNTKLIDEKKANFTAHSFYCFTPINDPAWSMDPCCNSAATVTMCCAGRDTIVSSSDFDYRNASVEAVQCQYPDCIRPVINGMLESPLQYRSLPLFQFLTLR